MWESGNRNVDRRRQNELSGVSYGPSFCSYQGTQRSGLTSARCARAQVSMIRRQGGG